MQLYLKALLELPTEDITYDLGNNHLYLRKTPQVLSFLQELKIIPNDTQYLTSLNHDTWIYLQNGFEHSLILKDEYPHHVFEFVSYDKQTNTFAYKCRNIYLKIPSMIP